MLTTGELHVLQALVSSVRHHSCLCQLPSPHANLPILDTPYTRYINTPFAAKSEHDVHAITEILRQRQAQLDAVAAEIATVESFLNRAQDVHQQFLDKRDKIFASMRFHQGLLSSVRRLPMEILSKIFILCLPSGTYIEPNSRTVAPLALSSVCREWRKVALGMPRLWCSLTIRPSHRREEQRELPFYNTWLSRACDSPLSLAIDMRPPPQNPKWPHYVMNLFYRYSSRVTRLRVTFDESDVIFSSMMLRDMPSLEHLTAEGNRNEFTMKLSIEQPEPRLRSLALEGVKLQRGRTIQSTLDLGWVHLTRLRINFDPTWAYDDADADSVFTFLALCPCLQVFDFSPVSIPRLEMGNSRPLTHTHLHSLNAFVLHGAGRLLDTLTLPALRHLRICDVNVTRRTWWRNEFKTFVERSQCPLETVGIHGGRGVVTQEDQAACALLIPTLKHLDLSSVEDAGVGGPLEL